MMFRWLLLLLGVVSSSPSSVPAADGLMFEDRVFGLSRPIAGSATAGGPSGGTRSPVTAPDQKGRQARPRALVAGSLEKSPLVQKLVSGQMPPGKELKPTAAHIETIKAWVAGGARARYVARGLDEAEEPVLEESDRPVVGIPSSCAGRSARGSGFQPGGHAS
ncbi:MAG: hypothetical protein Ct9H300mP1_34260 [Planctomycetaceae bacterium]|nr:MAG: hypothetical protein Ct9H300mP1_34260 [Planctomycetaceae bacterium]